MKKRVIECYLVLAFAGLMANGAQSLEPEPHKWGGQRVDLETVMARPTVEKHEIKVVEISEDDLESEEFCDSLEILAQCVEAEAGNQSLMGKRLVADVILNRVESPRFPDDIESVISQKYHFTTYWDGTMASIVPSDETFEAVQMELYGQRLDEDILFFTAGDYNRYCIPAYTVGDHYFGY